MLLIIHQNTLVTCCSRASRYVAPAYRLSRSVAGLSRLHGWPIVVGFVGMAGLEPALISPLYARCTVYGSFMPLKNGWPRNRPFKSHARHVTKTFIRLPSRADTAPHGAVVPTQGIEPRQSRPLIHCRSFRLTAFVGRCPVAAFAASDGARRRSVSARHWFMSLLPGCPCHWPAL